MAKKSEDTNVDYTEVFMKTVKKTWGNVIGVGRSISEEKRNILSISPAVDLNGGAFMEGTCVSLVGPEKVGKTTMALVGAVEAQRQGMTVFIDDIEERLKSLNVNGIPGLDLDKIQYIRSSEDCILSGTDHLKLVEVLLETIPHVYVIMDGMSALQDNTVADVINKEDRGAYNKPISRFLNKIPPVLRVKKSILVGITHQIANTSGYGYAKVEKASNRWKYQTDTKLVCKNWKYIEEDGKKIGKEVTWECVQSATGSPGSEFTSYLRFGQGIDKLREIVEIAAQVGIIEKPEKGAWFTYKEQKFQGVANMCNYLAENKEEYDSVYGQLKELIGI